MTCPICEKEFEVIRRLGGMNREICYDCLPDGLPKYDRQKAKLRLIRAKTEQIKVDLGCSICGYNTCAAALEWHHDDANKEATPSNLLRDGTIIALKRFQAEISKCQLLCANCHRELHFAHIMI